MGARLPSEPLGDAAPGSGSGSSPHAGARLKNFGIREISVLAEALDAILQDARNTAAEAADRRERASRSVASAREVLRQVICEEEAARAAAAARPGDDRDAQQAMAGQARAAEAAAAARDHLEQAERSFARSTAAQYRATAEYDRLLKMGEAMTPLVKDAISATAARAPELLPDTDGFDLRPDPLRAQTAAELVGALRRYRAWAGEPPFRQMAVRARQKVAHSTLHAALDSDGLPRQEVVIAVIAGCGGSEDEQRRYVTAWRRIKFGTAEAEPAAGTSALRALPGSARSRPVHPAPCMAAHGP